MVGLLVECPFLLGLWVVGLDRLDVTFCFFSHGVSVIRIFLDVIKESISRHGRLSYYHNNREDAAFDPALRIAAGGDPVRLAEVSGSDTSVPIAYWSWSDDGKTVKIYIEADQEPRAVAAAERASPETDFTQDSFRLTVNDDGRSFVLFVQHLHHDIHPRQSKVRVSAWETYHSSIAETGSCIPVVQIDWQVTSRGCLQPQGRTRSTCRRGTVV